MMIPRTLVPSDCAMPASSPSRPPRRLKTWLDDRALIPQDMPVVPFDGVSSIPTHVPLDVLNNRVLIARDLPVVPFPEALIEAAEPPITEMDERVVVPPAARLDSTTQAEPFPAVALQDLVESDLLVAGEARLLPEKKGRVDWDLLAPIFSLAFHILLILSFFAVPGMMSRIAVNPVEEASNQQKLQNLGFIYLPPEMKQAPKPLKQKPSNQIKIDIGALKKTAPPKPKVSRQQGPAQHPTPEVTPPKPQPPVQSAQARPQPIPQPPPPKPQPPRPKIEPITPKRNQPFIPLPSTVPGNAIRQSLRAAAQQHSPDVGFQDQIPPPPSLPGGPGQQGGPGPGYLAGSIQLLTPTQGVDFTNYIQRLLAIVRRNWYAVMPESAMLGDKGRVMLRFKILRNGALPSGEPILELGSGKQPLDHAAEAAITASNPFDPLPQAFTGPYIELRFIFLYNLPINAQ